MRTASMTILTITLATRCLNLTLTLTYLLKCLGRRDYDPHNYGSYGVVYDSSDNRAKHVPTRMWTM
jgi:hypothetical protein